MSGIAQLYGVDVLRKSLIYTTSDLYLTPAPGALAHGYTILAPYRHYLAYAALPDTILKQCQSIVTALRVALANVGPLAIFEHGTGENGERGAACVTHAHLHCCPVPDGRGLHAELASNFDYVNLKRLTDLPSVAGTGPYLLFGTAQCTRLYLRETAFESQLIRKLVAQQLRISREWNWRTHPRGPTYIQTLATLQATQATLRQVIDANV
jgi:diadenosine tetraphosphate (Ap4A) HIT family hydrolase